MKGFNITYTIIAIIFSVLSLNAQNTFFVNQTGTGQGTSWGDASNDLNAVLFAAQAGDQVWVAKGVYLPTADYNRNIAFNIKSDVEIYGGFAGSETQLSERDYTINTTILSGELNTNSTDDNSYNVVLFKNASSTTILDGFTISGGTGNGDGTTGARNRCGGGIYNDGAGNSSNPTIANCIIQNNSSRDGGAVYNNGIAGKANATFIDCDFLANNADFDGGAIFNDARNKGESSSKFINCSIKGNKANYGGGVCNYAGTGESSPIFENCQFAKNYAKMRGGGMYNMDVEGICEPIIKHCSFAQNDASTGASIQNLTNVHPLTRTEQFAADAPREWSN
jgi:hypothetical protein